MNKIKKISFVIPCYNSEKYIDTTIEELQDTIKKEI